MGLSINGDIDRENFNGLHANNQHDGFMNFTNYSNNLLDLSLTWSQISSICSYPQYIFANHSIICNDWQMIAINSTTSDKIWQSLGVSAYFTYSRGLSIITALGFAEATMYNFNISDGSVLSNFSLPLFNIYETPPPLIIGVDNGVIVWYNNNANEQVIILYNLFNNKWIQINDTNLNEYWQLTQCGNILISSTQHYYINNKSNSSNINAYKFSEELDTISLIWSYKINIFIEGYVNAPICITINHNTSHLLFTVYSISKTQSSSFLLNAQNGVVISSDIPITPEFGILPCVYYSDNNDYVILIVPGNQTINAWKIHESGNNEEWKLIWSQSLYPFHTFDSIIINNLYFHAIQSKYPNITVYDVFTGDCLKNISYPTEWDDFSIISATLGAGLDDENNVELVVFNQFIEKGEPAMAAYK